MKICLLGDIHGNLEALHRAMEEIKQKGVDKVYFLGDLVGYGADPRECIRIAKENFDIVIAGNHDLAASGVQDYANFNPQAAAAVIWTYNKLDPGEKEYLSSLPLVYEENGFTLVHASLPKPEEWRYLFSGEEAASTFKHANAKIVFVGHSHIPMVLEVGDEIVKKEITFAMKLNKESGYIINVGSVGQPRDEDSRICMVFYDTETMLLEFRRCEYNFKAAQDKIIDAGLPEVLALRLGFGK